MKRNLLLIGLILTVLATNDVFAQKKWVFGDTYSTLPLPAVAFDSDKGFRYGALNTFVWHGELDRPLYKHLFYIEWSHTTKGSDIKQFKYDSEYLIPGVRFTGLARLETDQFMDFYGFNGYEALYNPAFENPDHADYISRMYYRMYQQSLRIKTDFQGKILGNKLRWFGGFAFYNLKVGSIDLDKANKGKTENLVPDVNGLYDDYVDIGVVPEDQALGGSVKLLKAGLVADTRDNEPNPNRGIWSEAMIIAAPGFLWNQNPYTALVLTHCQYFSVLKDRLTLAYRLNYQSTLSGSAPWYMLTFKPHTFNSWDGLGGSKTLRGIMRNRVVGEGTFLGNFEVRWEPISFNLFKKETLHFDIAFSPFVDIGRVTKKYEILDTSGLRPGDEEGFHVGYGAGVHIIFNKNIIVAVDYGLAGDPRDGDTGLYIGLDFLF